MKNSGKLVSFLVPIISILLAFVIGCIIMAVLGANPFVALESLWIGAFGSLRNVGTTLARSTPLIICWMAVHAADLHQPVRLLCIPLRRVQPGW